MTSGNTRSGRADGPRGTSSRVSVAARGSRASHTAVRGGRTTPSLFHITHSTQGRIALTRNHDELRDLVSAVSRACRALALFCAVDDHLHLVPRTALPRFLARDVIRSIHRVLPDARFQTPFVRPVASRKHLERLVSYLLGQPRHHALPVHPALWPGACLPDLLGARLLPGFDPRVLAGELPRLRGRDLLRAVALPDRPFEPAGDEQLAEVGLEGLIGLAVDVFAVSAQLVGRCERVVAARTLIAQAAARVGLRRGAVAERLRVTDRGMRRLVQRQLGPAPHEALRRALSLRLLVRDAVPIDVHLRAGEVGVR